MSGNHFQNIEQLEGSLWEAADQLRANSKLTSSEYCMPVLGIIFLRHATNRYDEAVRQIEADQAAGKMAKRKLIEADFLKRRALMLPAEARYDEIRKLPKGTHLGTALVKAMEAIEASFPPLVGQLPKDYDRFGNDILEAILRTFDSEALRKATGDVFGRIYEYFLMKFAMQGAQDNGEFFTPPSLVQTIVNVIEPEHGVVADLACGSGGMFVQTSHFIERLGQDTTHRVTFFGQEKTATTIRLAKMNLAVHGLEGDIREANTFYEDVHRLADGKPLWGNCDFIMANPPFNVDMVDAVKAKEDERRLPFGLPGVNKEKKVSNGNYLWISYFHSYLAPKGRAGFVMSSQASSAGHGEAEVRRKIVETGDVDAMISIRSNFFYTRTVPCELWFFDKGKPKERRDAVLMLDARHVYRKVTKKIYDFTPEQLADLTAIVWLHRGEAKRFAALLDDYREKCREHRRALIASLPDAREALLLLGSAIKGCATALPPEYQAMMATLGDECAALEKQAFKRDYTKDADALPDFAVTCRALQHRLREVRRVAEPLTAAALDNAESKEVKKELRSQRQRADEAWTRAAVEAEANVYFARHIEWLLHRFPEGRYRDVPGLCKVVTRADIAAVDWSLTPSRYVGVADVEVDEDFDFDQTMQDIHTELKELNAEAATLAGKIETNFEELLG